MSESVYSIAIFLLLSVYTFSAQKTFYPTQVYYNAAGTEILIEGSLAAEQAIWPGGVIDPQAHHLVRALQQAPETVRTVHLNLHEADNDVAMAVAGLIRRKGWSTHVQRNCFGGCTIMFAAGQRRSVDAGATVLFREVRWFAGNKLCMKCPERIAKQEKVNELYRSFGLPDTLVQELEAGDLEMEATDDRLRRMLHEVAEKPFDFAGAVSFFPYARWQ